MQNTNKEKQKSISISKLAFHLSETLNVSSQEQTSVVITNRGVPTHIIQPINKNDRPESDLEDLFRTRGAYGS